MKGRLYPGAKTFVEVGSKEALMQLVQLVQLVVVPVACLNQQEAAHSLTWIGARGSNFLRAQNDCGFSHL